jgi:hypothetical protein
MPDRRTFLASLAAGVTAGQRLFTTGAAPSSSSQPAASSGSRIRKAVLISMLPKELSYAQKFALGREAGFEGIEMRTVANAEEAAEIRDASAQTGLKIHSVMNADHWRFPLSSGGGSRCRAATRRW